MASQSAELFLALVFYSDCNRIEVGLNDPIDFRKRCAEFPALGFAADEPGAPCAVLHEGNHSALRRTRQCCCSFTIYRRSKNPRPSKIAGIAFSIRAVRVPDCFAPAK